MLEIKNLDLKNSISKNNLYLKKNSSMRVEVFLCDLTHAQGESISSNVFPLGVGLLASYVLDSDLKDYFTFELFKYPEDLNIQLNNGKIPKIIGFSNYSWSLELSVAFAKAIKSKHPDVVIVFGGPNYGLSDDEVNAFWNNYGDCIDFNVVLEGEIGFYKLLQNLAINNFNIENTKKNSTNLQNIHFKNNKNQVIKSEISPRVIIDELPSPYIDFPLMEKFFDGKLIPLTHTTRGCPFKCTFCSEGADYYNKVKQRTSRLSEEFEYIAKKATSVGIYDLMLSDANYGMFADDGPRADSLAKIQDKYGYPKNIYVSTGKNQKTRVLTAVKKLRGAIQLSASLQTTNEQVLDNIERSNISLEALSDAAKEASENKLNTYSELILGLPGETLTTHIQSIIDVINAGFTTIRIYQLILLPQTELNTVKTRKLYNFETAFRPMPRSFGVYKLFNDKKLICEYEEIVIGTKTMPRADYEIARKIDLIVDLVHNGKMYKEVINFLEYFNLQWKEYISFLIQKVRLNKLPENINNGLNEFIKFMHARLFESREKLLYKISGNVPINSLQILSQNEFAYFKSRFIFKEFIELNSFVFDTLREFIAYSQASIPSVLVNSLEQYCILAKSKVFDIKETVIFEHKLNSINAKKLFSIINPNKVSKLKKINYEEKWTLNYSKDQKKEIERLLKMYGQTDDGLSRIVMRAPNMDLYHRIYQED